MAVSAARLAANRKNAQKSTGPRTEEGKQNSKFNALTHGLRAKTLILPDEDPREFADRAAAWTDSLCPRNQVEQRAVHDAVAYSWQQDRARRAQVARISSSLVNQGGDADQGNLDEVLDLGRRLFKDRLGPLPLYPTGCDYGETTGCRVASTSYAADRDDPDQPDVLVVRLQATLRGCEWLLAEWSALRAILDRGQHWLSADKLKAVRLLGKQPFDTIDDRDVAMVFLASHALTAAKGRWDWEIVMELNDDDTRRFRKSARVRQLASLAPNDAAAARNALLELIGRVTDRLTAIAKAHRQCLEAKAALRADALAFDDSPAGESLRRYELASGRALARSLDTLLKLRRAPAVAGCSSSVVGCPPSGVSGEAEATDPPLETGGAAATENVTNEPIAASEVAPGVDHDTVSIERTIDTIDVVAAGNSADEPAVALENLTNEATPAASDEAVERPEPTARVNAPDERPVEPESDRSQGADWIQAGIATIASRRAERVRRLNEDARREAAAARAIRSFHRRGRDEGKPKRSRTSTRPKKIRKTSVRTSQHLDDLANEVVMPLVRASPEGM